MVSVLTVAQKLYEARFKNPKGQFPLEETDGRPAKLFLAGLSLCIECPDGMSLAAIMEKIAPMAAEASWAGTSPDHVACYKAVASKLEADLGEVWNRRLIFNHLCYTDHTGMHEIGCYLDEMATGRFMTVSVQETRLHEGAR